jgi:hypothetical protein
MLGTRRATLPARLQREMLGTLRKPFSQAYNFPRISMYLDQPNFPAAEEHAAAILEALEGDYQTALEYMAVYRDEFGENYARRLATLLTPQGEC